MEKYIITVDNRSFNVEIDEVPNKNHLKVKVNGQEFTVTSEFLEADHRKGTSSRSFLADQQAPKSFKNSDLVSAPMPGIILTVHVSEGDQIEQGAALLAMESMKMESQIVAPRKGIIEKIYVHKGQKVASKAPLIEFHNE